MATVKKAKQAHESDDEDYYERFVRSFQRNTADDSEELDEEASFQGDINMDDDED
eukprot:CAMPEP_0196820464 /NCGR_PEP_ID=MMETSP1362-20130617/75398_1 /TAXON_ID=163516 /ORGANISM="Leptocylindrus danicus, Strain CCMP1856" /LENGTH=54 /DNA_ID=CAMNT_0042199361 /DNA_START=160 /DNA_END=321 /DNA_ORIENTATION=+